MRDQIELVVGDVRDVPESALDGIDGVINLSGLSNDPTAEFNPEANWQMNAIATETLGRACLERGIERYVFASSCSLYDGMPPGMHAEDADIQPRAAYATSKRYGEEKLLELAGEGLCPVILRNGTVYGWSPRMRFDLVVNTFVKDALLSGSLKLHGGGWMWRPLVDIRDCADAMIAAYEAPAEKVRGEIFNVVHSNYQIRELAMIVAGSVQLHRPPVHLEEVPGAQAHARLRVRQRQALDDARLHPPALGARGRQRPARTDRRRRSGRRSPTRAATTSAGSSCCTRSSRCSTPSPRCCEGAYHGRRRPARPRSRVPCSASPREPISARRARHHRRGGARPGI